MAEGWFRVIRCGEQCQPRGLDLEIPYPILGLLPGLVWLLYFYRKGAPNRQSFGNIARVFLYSCISTIPTAVLEHVTGAGLIQDTVLRSALTSYLLIGPIEEMSKLIAVWVAVYRTSDFREPLDGIVYSASAALGFASVENIVYLAWMGPEVVLSRTVFATPAHVMFSAMWGYSMGLARFKRDGELLLIAKGFFLAACFHGTYNFLVALHPKAAMITLMPLMVFMGWLMNLKIQEFRRIYPFPAIGEGPLICCPACGAYTLEQGESCSRCGSAIPLLESDAPRFCGRCRAVLDPCRESCPRCGTRAYLSRFCPPAAR